MVENELTVLDHSNTLKAKLLQPFSKKTIFRADIIAGITVGLVLIPQSLAYAQLAGLPPHYGLYASLLPPFLAALFGSSGQLSTGPVAVLSVLALSAISPIKPIGSNDYISLVILLALFLGFFQLLLGVFKLGGLASFLSHPVTYAFTNASALIIASTQLSNFFGVSVPTQPRHYQTIISVIEKTATSIHWPTVIVGCITLTWMIVLKRLNKNLPYILLTTIVISFLVAYFHYPVATIGSVPSGLPKFTMPKFSSVPFDQLLLPVITMSLIGFTQTISIAQAIAIKTKDHLDPNKELIGQGISNMVGAFNQGYPVAGSFPRTALNYQAGGKTWFASFITSCTVFVTLLFFTQLLAFLPKVVLASIIMLSVSSLLDFSKVKVIMSVSRYDGTTALITFFGTLYFAPNLEKGLLLGIAFSLGHFVLRNTRPKVAFLSLYKDGFLHDYRLFNLEQCKNIAVVRLDAPLFFANATYFENEIIKYLSEHPYITHIIFSANGINDIDSTGEELLESFVDTLKQSKKHVSFAVVKYQVMEIFKKTGLYESIGARNFYPTTSQALHDVIKKLNDLNSHIDRNFCPLIKYITVPIEEFHHQRSRRERVAYYYQKLLKNAS